MCVYEFVWTNGQLSHSLLTLCTLWSRCLCDAFSPTIHIHTHTHTSPPKICQLSLRAILLKRSNLAYLIQPTPHHCLLILLAFYSLSLAKTHTHTHTHTHSPSLPPTHTLRGK